MEDTNENLVTEDDDFGPPKSYEEALLFKGKRYYIAFLLVVALGNSLNLALSGLVGGFFISSIKDFSVLVGFIPAFLGPVVYPLIKYIGGFFLDKGFYSIAAGVLQGARFYIRTYIIFTYLLGFVLLAVIISGAGISLIY